ncbi:MAG: BrnT family toxin [Pseudomonadota bacterium]|nr:BrnT family toxin [Pseudomonadota bacterium]
MDIGDFDPDKDAINRAKHDGVSLGDAAHFDIDTALVAYDDRHADAEDRFKAVGFIGAVLHVLVFTERGGQIRPISLRRADKLEVRSYEKHKSRYGF